jgi:hypothetical protein
MCSKILSHARARVDGLLYIMRIAMVLPSNYEPLIDMLINTYYLLRGNRISIFKNIRELTT